MHIPKPLKKALLLVILLCNALLIKSAVLTSEPASPLVLPSLDSLKDPKQIKASLQQLEDFITKQSASFSESNIAGVQALLAAASSTTTVPVYSSVSDAEQLLKTYAAALNNTYFIQTVLNSLYNNILNGGRKNLKDDVFKRVGGLLPFGSDRFQNIDMKPIAITFASTMYTTLSKKLPLTAKPPVGFKTVQGALGLAHYVMDILSYRTAKEWGQNAQLGVWARNLAKQAGLSNDIDINTLESSIFNRIIP